MEANNPVFNIALSIKGTRQRQSGFGLIANIGALAGWEDRDENMDRSPVSSLTCDENPVIVIKNTKDYVFYMLLDGMVKPADSSNPGRLSIGITIPSNARMKGGKSPYSLLMDIYDKFKEKYMTPLDDKYFRFNTEEVDVIDFKRIVEDYPIEEIDVVPVAMTGATTGLIRVPESKLLEFFIDTQYDEFAYYKDIEVTTRGDNMFPNIVIPNPIKYVVWINDVRSGVISNSNDIFTAKKKRSDDFKYTVMNFSLDGLRLAGNHIKTDEGEVYLDEYRHRIYCSLNREERWYTKEIKYTSVNPTNGAYEEQEILERVKKGVIKVLINGEERDRIRPSEAKEAISSKSIAVYPSDIGAYHLSVSACDNDFYDKIEITIKIVNKEQENRERKRRERKKRIIRISIITFIAIALIASGLMWYNYYNKRKTMTDEENMAFEKVCGITDPDSIDSLYSYLEKYTKMNNQSVGDGRYISSGYKYPNESHKKTILNYLENYYKDVEAEEGAYGACKDTTSCKDYLNKYSKDSLAIDGHQIKIKTRHNDIKSKLDKLIKQAKFDKAKANQREKCLNATDYTSFIKEAESFETVYYTDNQIDKKKNDYNNKRNEILNKINNTELNEWKGLDTQSYKTNLLREEITAIDSLKSIITNLSELHSIKQTNLQDKGYYKDGQCCFKNWDDVKTVKENILDKKNIEELNNY